ncbi:3589_t:CDS:2 [Ambispora gerdemannii]|uniref:3589_t:CDS:1 n=1 Tax=Ambispora gerdemannii TaxID=144530 RepID=A0A9N9CXD9_9GLOM|nr:3589_t:CDS:2 [Ambispora gerdemannii]
MSCMAPHELKLIERSKLTSAGASGNNDPARSAQARKTMTRLTRVIRQLNPWVTTDGQQIYPVKVNFYKPFRLTNNNLLTIPGAKWVLLEQMNSTLELTDWLTTHIYPGSYDRNPGPIPTMNKATKAPQCNHIIAVTPKGSRDYSKHTGEGNDTERNIFPSRLSKIECKGLSTLLKGKLAEADDDEGMIRRQKVSPASIRKQIRRKNVQHMPIKRVTDPTARNRVYNEIMPHLPGITKEICARQGRYTLYLVR